MVFNNWINIYKSLDFGFIDKTGNKYIFINSSSKGWMKQYSVYWLWRHMSLLYLSTDASFMYFIIHKCLIRLFNVKLNSVFSANVKRTFTYWACLYYISFFVAISQNGQLVIKRKQRTWKCILLHITKHKTDIKSYSVNSNTVGEPWTSSDICKSQQPKGTISKTGAA